MLYEINKNIELINPLKSGTVIMWCFWYSSPESQKCIRCFFGNVLHPEFIVYEQCKLKVQSFWEPWYICRPRSVACWVHWYVSMTRILKGQVSKFPRWRAIKSSQGHYDAQLVCIIKWTWDQHKHKWNYIYYSKTCAL